MNSQVAPRAPRARRVDTRRRIAVLRPFFLLATALVVGCESPVGTAPPRSGATDAVAAPASFAKTTQPPATATCTLCTVEVNVKHGNDQGKINLKGIGNSSGNNGNGSSASLTVSVLGTGAFDLSAVDLSSLRIGDAATIPITPVEQLKNKYQAGIVDLNGDGILDLMLHFGIGDMVDNGNLSGSTTSLCLVGSGPGYTIHGCGAVTVMGDAGGTGGGGFTLTELMPWGYSSPGSDAVRVGQVHYGVDPSTVFPGWETVDMSALGTGAWATWKPAVLPLANETPSASGYLAGTCGITTPLTSPIVWASYQQAVIRTDVTIPAGATKVSLQFLVDDAARVFVNGTEVTSGFQTAQAATCVSYSTVVTVPVPDAILSPDGNNKVAVWTKDTFGYVNYFDMRVTAQVRN